MVHTFQGNQTWVRAKNFGFKHLLLSALVMLSLIQNCLVLGTKSDDTQSRTDVILPSETSDNCTLR
jgi:hypothetical protein